MRRDQLYELHYITPIANLPSILREGILCNRASRELRHDSVAMPEIQARRAEKTVPGGRPLHDYACLYFHARNPMLYKRKDRHAELCILRVSSNVLDLPEVVITSQNASSGYARFYPSPDGLQYPDYELVVRRILDPSQSVQGIPTQINQVCRGAGTSAGSARPHFWRLRLKSRHPDRR